MKEETKNERERERETECNRGRKGIRGKEVMIE